MDSAASEPPPAPPVSPARRLVTALGSFCRLLAVASFALAVLSVFRSSDRSKVIIDGDPERSRRLLSEAIIATAVAYAACLLAMGLTGLGIFVSQRSPTPLWYTLMAMCVFTILDIPHGRLVRAVSVVALYWQRPASHLT